jgi:hypothetical protein
MTPSESKVEMIHLEFETQMQFDTDYLDNTHHSLPDISGPAT